MKVVCFDLGGVLVRITMSVAEAGRRAGIEGLPDRSFMDLPMFVNYQAGRIECDEYVEALAKFLDISSEVARATHNHILIEPYAGSEELIAELSDGLITACLSNTNELHWREMLDSGRFPNVQRLMLPVASHIVKMEKPNPEIFAEFERLAGTTGPEIVFFDDSPVNVAAATAAGWTAHWIDPYGHPAAQMASLLEVG